MFEFDKIENEKGRLEEIKFLRTVDVYRLMEKRNLPK
jgi:hypothetical protein